MKNVAVVIFSILSLIAMPFAFAQGTVGQAIPGEYIVKYKNYVTSALVQNKISQKVSFKGTIPMQGVYHVQLKPGAAVHDLSDDPDVEYVEPNYILTKADDAPPGEPEHIFSDAEMLAMSSTDYYQNFAPTQLKLAWQSMLAFDINRAQNRPVVAVIDTGLQGNHRVITDTNALWYNQAELNGSPGVDDDGNGFTDDINGWNFITNSPNYADDQGHGTHVAGIVLGTGLDILNSTLDPALVQLMPLKFLDSTGAGTTANAIRAMYYAVDNGARVINCSWGGGSYSRSLHDAMKFAYDHEVLVVSAAGNNTYNNDSTPNYPANYDVPSNISVAATTDADVLAYFSNYGNSTVHVAAPGYQIYSLYRNNNFSSMSGTSMAAPFVAGLAALAIRERPTIKGYQLKQVLMDSIDTLGSLSGKISSRGRVNAYKLITSLQSGGFVVASSQPNYVAVYKAEGGSGGGDSKGGKGAGCGSIAALKDNLPPGFGLLVGFFLLAPVVAAYIMRRRDPANRRQFERFNISSSVTVQCGEHTIVGSMKTISLGGMSFDAASALEKGGNVSIKIDNPAGGEPIEIEGRIVWSAQNQSYGVQFGAVQDSIKSSIESLTSSLIKAS